MSNGENAQNPLGFCYTNKIIFRNFDLLEIKTKKISGGVFSHANRDYYASMEGVIDKFLHQMRYDMRFFTGEESVFRDSWTGGSDDGMVSWGAWDRKALIA